MLTTWHVCAPTLLKQIGKHTACLYAATPCTLEEMHSFWNGTSGGGHNKKYTLRDHLNLIETFAGQCDYDSAFTASGCSVGECKLFATLEIVVHALGGTDVLDGFPKLLAFYKRFRALPATQDFLEKGAKFPNAPMHYYKTLEECEHELKKSAEATDGSV